MTKNRLATICLVMGTALLLTAGIAAERLGVATTVVLAALGAASLLAAGAWYEPKSRTR